ncbi:AraC family transcriptional regulator [Spiribacter halobius]|uniref:AraC family transcriptional regulator n=1 Tax=Sediminicurvatus halobius TaxID=2182432 RepID=A0A2U2N8E4_9GAMM|nr:AraC family transcriptional regulator [Spiribacter halobius]PWG65390.1 AraC family transcriptional regulator [Spiribacter halobius]UEX76409.1 AraC family transcriptional regulator [Spiribacter halobius]
MQGDILTDVLRAVHISGAVFFDVHAASPWASAAPHSREIRALVMPEAQHLIEYHVMVSGSCWATLTDGSQPPLQLLPGSILIFPRGDAHAMSSQPNSRAIPDLSNFAPGTPENPRPFYLNPGGDGPKSARIICGFLGCDAGPFNPLLQALPRLLHVADGVNAEGGLLGTLIEATVRESETKRIGGGGVLSKLAELIFIEAIRRYTETQPGEARSWLVGLREPIVGRALRALHADPRRAWTLGDLAREACASRSTLAQRFAEHLGMPPMAYLAAWRMQIAAGLLTSSALTIAQVAEGVGYESEASFGRAFKRGTGMAPTEWRTSMSGAGGGPACHSGDRLAG